MSDPSVTDDHAEHSGAIRIDGGATPIEVAAVITVISTLGASTSSDSPSPRRVWGAPSSNVRTALPAGVGAWRNSALPR